MLRHMIDLPPNHRVEPTADSASDFPMEFLVVVSHGQAVAHADR